MKWFIKLFVLGVSLWSHQTKNLSTFCIYIGHDPLFNFLYIILSVKGWQIYRIENEKLYKNSGKCVAMYLCVRGIDYRFWLFLRLFYYILELFQQCGIFCSSRFWNCSDSVVFFVFLDFWTVPTVWYFYFF